MQCVNQSINGKITHVGPHQKPDLSCMNWSHKFHYFRIMKKFIIAYVKSREIEDYLKIGVELKLFERKLDFWNLFENLSFEN